MKQLYSDAFAAGVLVVDEVSNEVLGFYSKISGYKCGLPFGKCDPGEDAATTAVRECLEETGYVVELEDCEPFVRYTAKDEKCYAFKAKILGVNKHNLTPGEGYPKWVKPSVLSSEDTGRFPQYLRELFDHFGVKYEKA